MPKVKDWQDIEVGENGYDWQGTVPIIKHRRKVFKEYINEFPISQLDRAFCLRHYHLLPKRDRERLTGYKSIDDVPDVWRYEGQCEGCWNCCVKIKIDLSPKKK